MCVCVSVCVKVIWVCVCVIPENGAGTVFTIEENVGADEHTEAAAAKQPLEDKPKKGKPTLTVVK